MTAERLRTEVAIVRIFIGQHDQRVADLDFSMAQRAIWTSQAHHLSCAKAFL